MWPALLYNLWSSAVRTQQEAKMAQSKTANSSETGTTAAPRGRSPRVPAIKSVPAGESIPAAVAQTYKRADLLNAVAARCAFPKSDLRAVLEVMLDEMGHALSADQDLALPPLGRLKIQRRKDTKDATVLTLRLRRKAISGARDPNYS